MKKVLSVMLAVAMILAVGAVGFASQDRSYGEDGVQLTTAEKRGEKERISKAKEDYLANGGSVTDVEYRILDEAFDKNTNSTSGTSSTTTKASAIVVTSEGDKVVKVKNRFEKYFSNEFHVIELSGVASLSRIRINNREKLNTDDLVFYHYDAEANRYVLLSDVGYEIDDDGMIRFSTDKNGYILISTGAISK